MNNNKQDKFIFMVGGETAGPIVPLLAVAEYWIKEDSNIKPIFFDVNKSAMKSLILEKKFKFIAIKADKFRRYWTLRTIVAPFKIFIGIIQSLIKIYKFKPKLIMGAGGYVQIPLILAGWIFRIPILIHQQDVTPTLSNKICAPFATKITTTFEKSVKDFSQGTGFTRDYSKHQKIVCTGNPSRSELADANKVDAMNYFGLKKDWPTLLIIGGGSGAEGLNKIIISCANDLLKIVQIIHSTGVGRGIKFQHQNYVQMPFIERMDLAYAASDIVMARSGIGTITELSLLKKSSILVPMPNSHQEANAEMLYKANAALVMDQSEINSESLIATIRKILFDAQLQKDMQSNIAKIMPKDANMNILKIMKEISK